MCTNMLPRKSSPGSRGIRGINRAATQARKKFIAGPAAATIIMPRRGSRNFQAATGTGLAQPNMKATRWMVTSWASSSRPGSSRRADPVHMPQRVERQPAGPACRVVPHGQRRVAMRRFVQGDSQHGGDHRQGQLNRNRSRQQPVALGHEGARLGPRGRRVPFACGLKPGGGRSVSAGNRKQRPRRMNSPAQ